MKKQIVILIFTIFLGINGVQAQQIPHYTQYMFNNYVINPALAGTHNYYQIKSNHRFQWVGINDPPLTNTLSIYGPYKTTDMGFGGYLYSDVTGPSSRMGLNGSYAYNIAISDDIRLSMGISIGLIQYKIDGTQITLKDPTDMTLLESIYSAYVPDASLGLYLYSSNFFVGFSATQLISNKLKLYEIKSGLSKLKSHFYLTGGYKYFINRDLAIEPSLMLKGTSPVFIQLDVNTKVIYQNRAWLGLSFRTQDAISILMGYMHENKIYFGYSYDFSISNIRKYNSGSHEIMIGYKFNIIPGR